MHVKICGLTNLDDALAAVDAGADHLGFNFYPQSPRYITPEVCAAIINALNDQGASRSAIRFVGVFVNAPTARVAETMMRCGLHLAQLHGDETPENVAALNGRAFKAFRGLRQDYASYAPILETGADDRGPAFLIDAYSSGAYGGTGQTVDWSAARTIAEQYPIFLAGGLTPENVAEAIAQAQPWGVDVASGVERAPGRKDHAKLSAFIRNALNDPITQ